MYVLSLNQNHSRKKKSSTFAVRYLKDGPKVDISVDQDGPQYAVGE